VLALLPPFVLIYLVSGWDGLVEAWPLAIVGSLSYILGQWPVAHFLLLVAFFIFAVAYVFVFTGMANSLAFGFSKIGWGFVIVAPLLGWIGVALSGSNTSTNAMFGPIQAVTGRLLHLPLLLAPSLNSVGAEVGKPIAPQTASVGVSTSKFVRSEGEVIRHNMVWTLAVLGYLVLIGLLFYFVFPERMAG
jgi:lactate permease